MNQQNHESRPKAATLVAFTVGFGAVFYLVLGLWLAFTDIPPSTPANADLKSLPDWFSLVNGLLSLTLGLIYMVLLRMVLSRATNAYPMIQAIALINIAFGLFRLPVGLLAIGISVVTLVLSNSKETKTWLTYYDS